MSVIIEKINCQDKFIQTPLLTKQELEKEIIKTVEKVRKNITHMKDKFPWSATVDEIYPIIENIEWTDGFWTGLLWLSYEFTGDKIFRDLAEKNVLSFNNRVVKDIELDHHDLGFLYIPSAVAGYKITGNEFSKETAIKAADKLMTRWQEKGEFFQAWGELGKSDNYRFIIDCMLNIPLLYWASEETGNNLYRERAQKHFYTTIRNAIRKDASTFHTYYMNPKDGSPVKGVTHQGYSDDSSWARGQAWGIYGLALNYKYTKSEEVIPLFKALTNYFLNRLPQDNVPYWDLVFTDGSGHVRDSSSAAIAICGIHEMCKYLEDDNLKKFYNQAAHTMLRSLMNNYTSQEHRAGNPILYHGVYSWHSGKGVDEGNIWGDYYYLEALMRYYKEWNVYW